VILRGMGSRRRRIGRDGSAGSGMDAELWGELQRYVDLKEVFAKLPLREFFQLRLVCKEWNRLASDQQFLEESFKRPIPKPYFVVNAYSSGRRKLTCLLTYDAASKRWSSTRLPSFLNLYSGDLVTEGLLHSYHHLRENPEQVFNIHTRVFHTLPEPLQFPEPNLPTPFPFRAMAVDTSQTFQLILSESSKNPPQIYSSKTNSWTRLASSSSSSICKKSCNVMYTRYENHILAYSLEEDAWVQLEAPPGSCETNRRSVGRWGGRLFDVTVDVRQRSVTVWERVEQRWKAFERLSEDLFSWLVYADRVMPPSLRVREELEIRACFCSEYVLVYSSLPEEALVERFLMCNLERKQSWERIDVGRLVHLPHREERRRSVGLKLMRTYALPEFDESLLVPGY
jgi:hypothetical protein